MTLLGMARQVIWQPLASRLLEFCYPGACACCRSVCLGHEPLCSRCQQSLDALSKASCVRCGAPLAQEEAPCPFCRDRGLYPFDRILRLGIYRDPLKDLIHQLKYNRRWPLGEYLAERLAEHNSVAELLAEADCLVPVPLHWRRHLYRGYNQAEVVARALANGHGLRVVHPAARIRPTETQTQFHSAARRRTNLRGAFALLRPRCVAGKRVVLVDDVMTSGSTLRELARTILPARPASLSAIVLAVADSRGQQFQGV